MTVYTLAGWFGTLLILVAYFLISTGRLNGKSRVYQAMNFFGAIGVGTNVFVQEAWPAFALQGVWLLIALQGFIRNSN